VFGFFCLFVAAIYFVPTNLPRQEASTRPRPATNHLSINSPHCMWSS